MDSSPTIQTHIHTYGDWRVFSDTDMHVFRIWEEAGWPAADTHKRTHSLDSNLNPSKLWGSFATPPPPLHRAAVYNVHDKCESFTLFRRSDLNLIITP